jgi:hypothetical protein
MSKVVHFFYTQILDISTTSGHAAKSADKSLLAITKVRSTPHTILQNIDWFLQVYITADKYDVPVLKDFAKTKFDETLSKLEGKKPEEWKD